MMERIGSYEVIRRLAAGGMGELFLAWQHGPRSFRRQVVLKRLQPKLADDPRVVEMFLRESELAASLSHANVVSVHELFEADGSFVLVMEHVDGVTLLEVLRRHHDRHVGLPPGAIVRIAGALCDALHYAYHAPGPDGAPRRIIHRDVSPSNVMIRSDGEVKLIDFGLAVIETERPPGEHPTFDGKRGYLAPEILRGGEPDHTSDVFSVGVVLWEMTTGRRMFRRGEDATREIPVPSSAAPVVPLLGAIVGRAVALDRSERYPDTRSLATDLRELAMTLRWPVDADSLVETVQSFDATPPVDLSWIVNPSARTYPGDRRR